MLKGLEDVKRERDLDERLGEICMLRTESEIELQNCIERLLELREDGLRVLYAEERRKRLARKIDVSISRREALMSTTKLKIALGRSYEEPKAGTQPPGEKPVAVQNEEFTVSMIILALQSRAREFATGHNGSLRGRDEFIATLEKWEAGSMVDVGSQVMGNKILWEFDQTMEVILKKPETGTDETRSQTPQNRSEPKKIAEKQTPNEAPSSTPGKARRRERTKCNECSELIGGELHVFPTDKILFDE